MAKKWYTILYMKKKIIFIHISAFIISFFVSITAVHAFGVSPSTVSVVDVHPDHTFTKQITLFFGGLKNGDSIVLETQGEGSDFVQFSESEIVVDGEKKEIDLFINVQGAEQGKVYTPKVRIRSKTNTQAAVQILPSLHINLEFSSTSTVHSDIHMSYANISREDEIDELHITGTIKNDGNTKVPLEKVTLVMYDSQDNELDTKDIDEHLKSADPYRIVDLEWKIPVKNIERIHRAKMMVYYTGLDPFIGEFQLQKDDSVKPEHNKSLASHQYPFVQNILAWQNEKILHNRYALVLVICIILIASGYLYNKGNA